MGKIRVLADNLANQIAAGEVVERPASVAKELIENSLDAGAKRIFIEIEAGGRRLLKITDDGEGMNRDDAILAFERHATSKLRTLEDLNEIATLGFRGEALASISSVSRVELTTKTVNETAGTRVAIEGGKLLDVKDAPHPTGTTLAIRDLFFNVPARRKFLRSESTENFHLINLVTHYALARPEIAFALTNNGRESLRVTPARDLRERAYQLFGADLIESLLPVSGGREFVAKISGYISAPRERRTSKDAQFFFINGRFVRDKIISRALTEGFRAVLPHGVFPVALLFVEIPPGEVDVNVHPQKTEVRFRRPEAVREVISEAIREALQIPDAHFQTSNSSNESARNPDSQTQNVTPQNQISSDGFRTQNANDLTLRNDDLNRLNVVEKSFTKQTIEQNEIDFVIPLNDENAVSFESQATNQTAFANVETVKNDSNEITIGDLLNNPKSEIQSPQSNVLPPLDSAAKIPKAVEIEQVASNSMRVLGQLRDSFIIAIDREGMLLIDQHVAHERILFDKYRKRETTRRAESQNLLLPETFDLTPAQVHAFDIVQNELEENGFGLMRLSGRTVAIKAVPADLPASGAKNLLKEILETVDAEKRGVARENWRDTIAASLACHAAVKINMPLTNEKMQWMIDALLKTSSPTTCPHGRPVILRLTMRDIERTFHRT
ncbi:MAG: DNA mismatch repair endonuclease MutL [Pyrinomonadaceae bacterium]|nr:DNA mismatch repair endonuclease MutL [Pyrinomonadaceae bacterium]